MSIRAKLLSVLVLIITAFGVCILVFLWSDYVAESAMSRAIESQNIVVQALRVGRNASEQKRDAREIVLDDMDEYRQFETHSENVESALGLWSDSIAAYASNTGDARLAGERQKTLSSISKEYDELAQHLRSAVDDKKRGLSREAALELESDLVLNYESQFLPSIESAIEQEKPRAAKEASMARSTSSTAKTVAVTVVLTYASIVIVVVSLVIRDVSSSIRSLKEAAGRLGGGELEARVDLNKRDEFGALAGSFNEMARDIQDSHEELERANVELAGFAYTVSHDLKGPIASIVVASDMLQERTSGMTGEGLDVKELADIVRRGSDSIARLTDDILALAEAGQMPTEVSDVDVNEVVRTVLAERATGIAEKGILVEVGRDMGTVRANPTHVYQVFTNLIGNAFKHNDCSRPVVEVTHLGQDPSGDHRYLVRDNGSGIPEEDLERIFIPFFKGKSGETGIGLSTVEKIVHLYGGHIKAYNDKGACFEFTLKDYSPPPDSE